MRLLLCSDVCPVGQADPRPSATTLKTYDVLILQADPLLYLVFRSQQFASISNSAGFAQTGILVSTGTTQARGAGVGATEALSGVSAQVVAGIQADRVAETARLTARTEEAKAQKALADAQAALIPAATDAEAISRNQAIATYQAEATLASAERAMLEAQAALTAARAQLSQ